MKTPLSQTIIFVFLAILSQVELDRSFDRYGRRDNRFKNTKKELKPTKNRYSGKMYFAIAAESNGQVYSRAFNKTLANITQSYIAGSSDSIIYNITLDTLVVDLPPGGRFSSLFLQTVCKKFDGKHIVAILVLGNTQAAFAVTLAARHAGIPVLWARGTNTLLPGFNNMELSPFEVYLEPTSRELLEALRALFIQTHWHSFTVLAEETVLTSVFQRQDLAGILDSPPLHPTILQLPSVKQPHSLFRRLADISRSTRGVVILICDRNSAGRVLDEAKRLNMVDGHFVWLWIDTVPSNITFERGPDPTEKPPEGKKDKRDTQSDEYFEENDIKWKNGPTLAENNQKKVEKHP